jgi:tetratricopeptide (TPR) repeat protein
MMTRFSRLSRRWILVASCLIPLLTSGCSGDPVERKNAFVQRADKYVADGKLAEAIIEYRNAIRIDETDGEVRKKLAQAFASSGEAARALEQYVRAADLLPKDVEAQLTAGSFLLLAQRFEDAAARADAALAVSPDSVPAHVLRGNALAGLSSFDEALKAIEEAIRLSPDRGDTFTSLGLVQMARGRRGEAEDAFTKAVALSPSSVEARLALGNFYWSTGRPKETEQAFADALRLAPNHQVANRAMAALMVATNRSRDAEPYLKTLADASKDVRAGLALADYYLASGNAKQAVVRLESMLQWGQERAVEQRLARAYAAAGDRSKAGEVIQSVLARDPAAVDVLLLKGQLLLNDGKRDEAFATVESAAKGNPASAEAHFALGRMYAARGDAAAAEIEFREVLRLNPRASAAQVEIAKLQLSTRRTLDSVKTAEEASRTQPGNLPARLLLVRGLLASKDISRAEAEIDKLLAEHPTVADVHAQAGFVALAKNDVSGARRAFERSRELSPDSFDALSGLVAADLVAKDPAAARARIERRLAQGSTPALQMLAAQTYIAINDWAAAERSLRAAIEGDNSNLQPYAMLGQLYVMQKKLDQARAEFEALAARQVKPVGALTMVGMIHQAQGDNANARKRYEQVLALDSTAVIANNNLAWLHAEGGENLDVALQMAQTAMAASPEAPEIIDTLGWVYYRRREFQRAIPLFERCVQKVPGNPNYRYHLGLTYLVAGDAAKGRAELQRALASQPAPELAAEIKQALENK